MQQLGWNSGALNWIEIALLIAAAIGIFFFLRAILSGMLGGGGNSNGGGSGGGGGAIYPKPPSSPNWGMHIPHNPKITDLSMPRNITEIRTPNPATPPKLNMELGRKLFTVDSGSLKKGQKFFTGDVSKTQPTLNQILPPQGSDTPEVRTNNQPQLPPQQPETKKYTGPNWKMAQDLFVPKIKPYQPWGNARNYNKRKKDGPD